MVVHQIFKYLKEAPTLDCFLFNLRDKLKETVQRVFCHVCIIHVGVTCCGADLL